MTRLAAIERAVCPSVSKAAIGHEHEPSGSSESAMLIARTGRDVTIASGDSVNEARIAFGCIVRPEPGDRVLTSKVDGTIWITSVLERSSDAPMQLWADGDVSIGSLRGDVSVSAGRSLNLEAGERARLAASELDLHAGVARFVLDELVQVGRRANLLVGKIRLAGEMVEVFAEHLLSRVRRSSRFVEESDQLRARDIDHRAESSMHLHADTALLTADTVVRVDADQIHMG